MLSPDPNWTDKQLWEFSAKALGWVNFPTDSIEQGSVWYKDAKKAPFGPYRKYWEPLSDCADSVLLETELRMTIQISNDGSRVIALVRNGEALPLSVCEWAMDHGSEVPEGQPKLMNIYKARRYAVAKLAALIYHNRVNENVKNPSCS